MSEPIFLLTEGLLTKPSFVRPIPRDNVTNKNKSIYFVLTNTKSNVGKVIKKVLDVDYNHISISFEDNFNEVYAFGSVYHKNKLRQGFIIEHLHRGLYKENDADYATYEMKVTEEEYQKIREALKVFIRNKDNYSFNMIGLVSNALGIPYNPNNAFFCSQFIAYLLQEAGIKLFDKSYGLVRPSDFMFHPDIKMLHKGQVKDRLKYEKDNKIRKQKYLY